MMVPTVFNKTQARARKSIFCVKSYKNVALIHLELIRDKLKILFGAENVFSGTLMRSMVPKCVLTTHFAKAVVSSLHVESIPFLKGIPFKT